LLGVVNFSRSAGMQSTETFIFPGWWQGVRPADAGLLFVSMLRIYGN
jgi:pantothenate kinase-related protein Tda10